jgi:succinate dehydrogenase/fumarate reductase cytochrome b subunit
MHHLTTYLLWILFLFFGSLQDMLLNAAACNASGTQGYNFATSQEVPFIACLFIAGWETALAENGQQTDTDFCMMITNDRQQSILLVHH